MSVKLFIKNNVTGTVHEYGTDRHDSLILQDDGSIHYDNMQTSFGTMFPEEGYSFVLADGSYPDIEAILDIGGVESKQGGILSRAVDMMKEFNTAMGLPIEDIGWLFREDDDKEVARRLYLREALLREEVRETRDAINRLAVMRQTFGGKAGWTESIKKDYEAAARDYIDGLADVLYIVLGAGLEVGLDVSEAFARVHESNMSKLDDDGKPVYNEVGKVMHGPNYTPPDFTYCYEDEVKDPYAAMGSSARTARSRAKIRKLYEEEFGEPLSEGDK